MTGEARVAVRLLLQHHPLCGEFAADRMRILGVAVCSGCLAAVPAAAAGFVLALQLIVHDAPPAAVFAAGAALGLPQLTTYRRRGGRAWRFAVKALGGLGLGAVGMSALVLPVPRSLLLAGALALTATFAGLQTLRVRSILRTCDACPFRRDWDACPGFRSWQDVKGPSNWPIKGSRSFAGRLDPGVPHDAAPSEKPPRPSQAP